VSVGLAATLLLIALIGRLGDIALVQGAGLSAYAVAERTRTVSVPSLRGEIVDAEGHVLAGNVVRYDVSLAPKYLPAADRALLAQALGETPGILAAAEKRGTPLYASVAQGLSLAVATRVQNLGLPDVEVTPVGTRTYPNGSLLGPILGFVGAGSQGLSGLEYEDNKILGGTPGVYREQVDAGGNPIASLGSITVTPPTPGDTLQLTLDRSLSQFAQQALLAGVRKTHAQLARAIVMDPNTGAILAVAQYPSMNPNDPGAASGAAQTDSIVQDLFSPGSTFKPVTAAGALTDGVISPTSRWYDPGYKVIDGVMLHGWEYPGSYGWVDLRRAFQVSSDIAFMDIGLAMGMNRFYADLKNFDLFNPPPIDLPGAAPGLILPESVAHPIDLADEAFGQTNEISAVQLAMSVSAVANGGLLMAPHVVGAILGPNGQVVRQVQPRLVRRVMPAWVSKVIRTDMESVVTPAGTGAEAAVPGYTLAGKTGTAQLVANGKVGSTYMSSFIGFGPMPNPKVLVLVQLNNPQGAYYGGQIAAPIFAQIMAETLRYEGIAPTGPLPATGVVGVPHVIGLSPAAADQALTRAGLVGMPIGTGAKVVAVSPQPGTAVAKGGSVVEVLGAALPGTGGDVPYLIGLTLRKAMILAGDRGFRLATTGSGIVVSQSPRAGTQAKVGSVLTATLRLPAPPPPPPKTPGQKKKG